MQVRNSKGLACALAVVAIGACTESKTGMTPNQPIGAAPTAGTQAAPVAGTGAVQPMAGMMASQPVAGMGGPAPAAGTGAAGMGGEPNPTPDAGTGDPIDGDFPDPRGCPGLDSGFPGDEACMLPPDPSEGFQIHIGPTDYTDQAQINAFSFEPGLESSECWSFHTPNTEDVYYQSFVLSGRPGTHHIINTMYQTDFPDGTTFTVCRDPGTGMTPDIIANLPGASKAYMPRRRIAPENEHLGRMVPANTASQADMHYFNFTDETILREFWLNIYTVPKDKITAEANQIRGMGGIGWQIAPGTDRVYQYSCPIDADGRITALLGHYHAHGRRFTAFVRSAGTATPCTRAMADAPGCKMVFEMYDYNDPQGYSYDSITTNPMFSNNAPGAYSGILEVKAGDVLDWECHIVNVEPDGTPGPTLSYSNQVRTGEMCNLWGESVGPLLNCVIPTFF